MISNSNKKYNKGNLFSQETNSSNLPIIIPIIIASKNKNTPE